jgi:hypothetical protein
MKSNPMQKGATPRGWGWTFSGHIFRIRWSFALQHPGAVLESPPHDGVGSDQGRKWQASLWVQGDAKQELAQEIIFYGQSLHALRLRASDWLASEQPQWFSNVSPAEKLNPARLMQKVVMRRNVAQPGVGTHLPRGKARLAADRHGADEEPVITAEMAQRYPLVFPEPKAAKAAAPQEEEHPEPMTGVSEGDVLYWSRDEERVQRERLAGTHHHGAGPNRFDRFEDAVTNFLWHDLLPEPGPEHHEEVFTSDVEFYTRVRSMHREDNELLIDDYLSRGWFYNGQLRGKVAPYHATGDGPLIVQLYHLEPHAR